MKILKEYPIVRGVKLKKIQYDGNDFEELKKRFPKINIEKLCEWLLKNNKSVIVDDCYDPQSGWQGANFIIDGIDFSGNGYCLSNEKLEEYINNN